MADARPDSPHLVGRHGCSDAAPADHDAPVRLAGRYGLGERLGEVRKVVRGVEHVRSDVDHLVTEGLEELLQLVLESVSAVVRPYRDAHTDPFRLAVSMPCSQCRKTVGEASTWHFLKESSQRWLVMERCIRNADILDSSTPLRCAQNDSGC